MTATLTWIFGGVAGAFAAPATLRYLMRRGVSAQIVLMVWAALVSTTIAAVALPGIAEVVHRCWLALHAGPSQQWDVVVGVGSGAAVVIAAARAGRQLHRGNRARHRVLDRHIGVARILHGVTPTSGEVLWLPTAQPLAYSLTGDPALIVASTGLRTCLDPDALAAVIEHERAHLCRRHHRLVTGAEMAAAAFPWLPLMRQSPALVRTLVEIDADAHVASGHGTGGLLRALKALGCAQTPATALAVTGDCTTLRLARLAGGRARRFRRRRGPGATTAFPGAILFAGAAMPAVITLTTLVSCASS